MTDIRDTTTITITVAEATRIAELLRKYEGSKEAIELTGLLLTRGIDALAEAHPVVASLTDEERSALQRTATFETKTVDGYVKPLEGRLYILRHLDTRGLVVKHPGTGVELYKTTEAGRAALAAHANG